MKELKDTYTYDIVNEYETIRYNIKDNTDSAYGNYYSNVGISNLVIARTDYADTIIYDEVLFKKALTNADICIELEAQGVLKHHEIIADSAEPKSIEEIRRLGWRIHPCSKGRDSINNGIQLMQQYPFLVTERSTNIIKNLRNYMWATDKTGDKTDKPIDKYNDAIDAMRYITQEKMSKRAVASQTTVSSYSRRR